MVNTMWFLTRLVLAAGCSLKGAVKGYLCQSYFCTSWGKLKVFSDFKLLLSFPHVWLKRRDRWCRSSQAGKGGECLWRKERQVMNICQKQSSSDDHLNKSPWRWEGSVSDTLSSSTIQYRVILCIINTLPFCTSWWHSTWYREVSNL